MTRIISIDGNIGSGKSTFVHYLKSHYDDPNNCHGQRICFLQEPIDIWNTITDKDGKTIIECFYADPEKYAFSFQMMAYISRLATLKKELKTNPDFIITERCIFTDRNVFAKMLYNDEKINEIDYKIYNAWFDEFVDDIPTIEYVYIKTDPQIAFDRIKNRGRVGENIPIEYLIKCHEYHETWLENHFGKCIINGNINSMENPDIIQEWITNIDHYIHTYEVSFDGASRGNPGPCGVGYVIKRNKTIIDQGGHFVSKNNTNNYAEYCGLIFSIKEM